MMYVDFDRRALELIEAFLDLAELEVLTSIDFPECESDEELRYAFLC